MTSIPVTQPDDVETARARRARRGHVASFGDGRTCAITACETTLSRYNDSDLCWHHAHELEKGARRIRA
jgi:hypothetical protein